jgi:hypothetical protein
VTEVREVRKLLCISITLSRSLPIGIDGKTVTSVIETNGEIYGEIIDICGSSSCLFQLLALPAKQRYPSNSTSSFASS